MKKEIHITVDGLKTVGVYKEGGRLVKRAEARCNPEDEFSLEIGAKLVVEKLLEKETTKSKIIQRTKSRGQDTVQNFYTI